MERCVQVQLLDYLLLKCLISQDQSAYLKNHSTLTSLHRIIDDWFDAINNDEFTGVCFLDVAKCFDSINHELLLQKLIKYGIKGNEHSWFNNYLSDRSQYVYVNGSRSTENDIKIGVPQGSILGPILFLLFINDLPNEVKQCITNLYADDCMIYVSTESIDDLKCDLQSDLNNVQQWFTNNRLTINTKKSCVMPVGNKNKTNVISKALNVKIDDQVLNLCHDVKYLGVTIDEHLKWSKHIDKVYSKLSSKIGLLSRISKFLPSNTLNTLYNTLIKPVFEYCISVWGDCFKKDAIKLQRLQNRAARLVTNNFDYNISGLSIVRDLKWLTVSEVKEYQTSCIMFKSLKGDYPNYIMDKFHSNIHVSNVNTRSTQADIFHVPGVLKTTCEQAISYKGPVCFNNLPLNVRGAENLSIFKCRLKKYFMSR